MKRLTLLKSFLWVALLSCFSSVVFADTYPVVSGYQYSASPIRSTPVSACSDVGLGGYPLVFRWNPSSNKAYQRTNQNCMTPWAENTPNDERAWTQINSVNSCPSGGTVSGANCINATPCVSPQVRSPSSPYACTSPPVVACPSGQYAPPGSTSTAACVASPNCNNTSPTDGKFFNVNTGQCEVSTNITLCITSVPGSNPTNFYCPPVNDCLPVAQSCTNNAADVQAATNARSAEIAAIKANADAKKSQADTEAATAASAQSAKVNLKAAALSAQNSAKAQSDSVAANTGSTPSQILAAAQNYADAVKDYTAAFAKSANSLLAAVAAQTAAADAMIHTDAIPSANPGNGQVYGDMVNDDLIKAIIAAGDAVTGLGSGTGTGQGASAGTCEQTNTCPDSLGLAKDTTLGATNGKLDGIANALKKDTAAFSDTPTVRTIGDSVELVSAKFKSKLPTVIFSDVAPECPIFTEFIPFINVNLTIDAFCTMDDLIRPTLQAVSLFIYALLAFLIVLRA
ncbi:hypothetical protein [Methylobacter sp. S3L5C]|uniref:hypothetical protein n=1 Tax=Methylobacter sp. S3L5C TaxID=2839024 RepID=UPI001FAB9FF4|nr:hypothetical protein [Methylobacter sp. S3L5C]UOA07511.1 hypothetical protein KKZ03_14715 [Methylobacter sp. S3L5C]